MPGETCIPIELLEGDLARIDAKLSELKREISRLQNEERHLILKKDFLAELAAKAVPINVEAKGRGGQKQRGETASPDDRPGASHSAEFPIPNGRVATPIIYQMLNDHPGMKSIDLIDALAGRVTKPKKNPRKFLGDLIWELGHRNKIRRESDGRLYLVEQGGEK